LPGDRVLSGPSEPELEAAEPPRGARPKVGLVLSGGGARGAYEVGVLRYIRERLKGDNRIDIITGSSIGAVNGAYIAATADRPKAQGRLLARVWSELNLDEVCKFGWSQMRALPQVLFGKVRNQSTHGAQLGGLVDPRAMQALVRTRLPWAGITENLHRGHLSAISCTATEVATGNVTIFVQTASGTLPPHWPSAQRQSVVLTPITAAHTLASGAIPVLFPAVRVGDQLYADGGLRQNTPLRPAMRLGATRLLVIGLRHQRDASEFRQIREEAESAFPSAMFMLGKVLNVLLLEKVENDLERIYRMNQILEAGASEFGDDFAPASPARCTRTSRPPTRTSTPCSSARARTSAASPSRRSSAPACRATPASSRAGSAGPCRPTTPARRATSPATCCSTATTSSASSSSATPTPPATTPS
jgi:NTE family protein